MGRRRCIGWLLREEGWDRGQSTEEIKFILSEAALVLSEAVLGR